MLLTGALGKDGGGQGGETSSMALRELWRMASVLWDNQSPCLESLFSLAWSCIGNCGQLTIKDMEGKVRKQIKQ